jgi:8-oxo-dGTP pyrophosphatase MutT (NUDIX family)
MNNIPKIRILKRHETLTHTLKNMLGITGITNQSDYNDDLESVIDVEEIIDMDNEYPDNDGTGTVISKDIGMKEITTEKVILIQRRNTIGFIEFMRGKYNVLEHDYIVKLFNMMTFDEKRLFREYDNFDVIRTIIGLKREANYKHEYDDARKKFNDLKNHSDGNLIFKLLDKSYTKWTTPEWGIPKGRRNNKEYDIECAVREFVEETGIKCRHINVYRNVKPLEEIYKGINGVVYKHIYYLASIKENDDARINIEIIERGGQINHEVSNVRLFGLSECHRLIRPYYISKMNVIKKGFQIINSMNQFFE